MDRKLVFSILEELIKIDTTNPPGNEKTAVQYLSRLFSEYGIEAEIQDLKNNRANLIVSYGNAEPELLFCGHLDVVPAQDGDHWRNPPFQPTWEDGRLYGRGTADMKSGVAAMSAALIRLVKEHARLKGKLTLVFVADEESSNLGMRHFLQEKRGACMAVIGEPTKLQVAVAHRGVLRDYINVLAPSYHAALPARKENAVNDAAEAMRSVFQLNESLKSFKHDILPPPSIAITKVEGYEGDNIVPGKIRLLTDFRILPGMCFEECRELEKQALTQIERYEIENQFYMSGGEIDPRHEFVKKCCEIGKEVLQSEQKPVAFDASCEQCFLSERGIPAVICGPGSLQQAHIIDEYVEEEQVLWAEQYYVRIAKELLMGDEKV